MYHWKINGWGWLLCPAGTAGGEEVVYSMFWSARSGLLGDFYYQLFVAQGVGTRKKRAEGRAAAQMGWVSSASVLCFLTSAKYCGSDREVGEGVHHISDTYLAKTWSMCSPCSGCRVMLQWGVHVGLEGLDLVRGAGGRGRPISATGIHKVACSAAALCLGWINGSVALLASFSVVSLVTWLIYLRLLVWWPSQVGLSKIIVLPPCRL